MRKVHLDFHTSEKIDICWDWSAEEFARTLKSAHVSQIVCFAKCHHGNLYWDSKIGPKHPGLPEGLDLIKEQIEVCRKNNIRINVYYSLMFDQVLMQKIKEEFDVELDKMDDYEGPDDPPFPRAKWMQLNKAGIPRFEEMLYGKFCLNSPYIEEVAIPHINELLEYDIDGLWFDICRQEECYCEYCKPLHEKWGLDLEKPEDRIRLVSLTINNWLTKILKVIREKKPNIEVFCNTIDHFGALDSNDADFIVNDVQDAWEQESLPSGGWGYWNFPVIGRYFRTLPHSDHSKKVIPESEPRLYGMTGMFRGSWGDNGSLKTGKMLLTESASIISLGYAGVDIGDQMHPSGKLEPAVYETIGKSFKYVEEREPWIKHSVGMADVAVLASTPGVHGPPNVLKSMVKMLIEGHVQFDVVDQNREIDPKYRVLIVPDYDYGPNENKTQYPKHLPISDKGWEYISNFAKNGGKVVLFGIAPSSRTIGNVTLPSLKWDTGYDVCYLSSNIPKKSDSFYPGHNYVLYSSFLGGQPGVFDGWDSKMGITLPYSKRTPNNFSSHRHWPADKKQGVVQPGAIQKENILWFLVPLVKQYWLRDDDNHRDMLMGILDQFVPNQLVIASDYPASTEINLTYQQLEKRYMLHVINWGMKRPGASQTLYEAPFELPGGPITLNLPNISGKVKNVRLVLDNLPVDWKEEGNGKFIISVPPTGFNSIIEISHE